MNSDLNQELQNKYPNLEISVLKYSDAMKDNDSKRIDSEFFKKGYLERIFTLKKLNYQVLQDIADIKGGKRLPLDEKFIKDNNGIPYIRAEDNKNGFVEFLNSPKISLSLHKKLKNYQTKYNDILITIVGNSIGDVGIVKFQLDKCNLTENCAKITNLIKLKPEVLFLFLLSKFGNLQISRECVGTAQPKLALERIRKFLIPLFPLSFQQEIEEMVKTSYACLEQSKDLYRQAEVLLYEELGLNPHNPLDFIEQNLSGSLNISVRPLSQSLNTTGRLDSEYYQQKYDEIERVIKNYRGGYMKLKDIGEFKNGSLISEDFYVEKSKRAYIRIKELSLNEPIKIAESVFIDDNFEANNETTVKENDFVIATIGNTIGKVNLIPKELNGSFISNNTSRFRLSDNEVIPKFLELLLRSILVQEQVAREFTQTAQPKISNYSLENMIIPKIAIETQTQIAEKIKQSFTLRKKASELLQTAKQSVETAIEKG